MVQRMHGGPVKIGVTGIFTVIRFIGGTVPTGGRGASNRHKSTYNILRQGIIFQSRMADNIIGF